MGNAKRSAESEKDKEMRLNKQKEFELKRYTKSTEIRAKKVQEVREKRSAQSEIEKESRLTQDKEYHSQKRSEESEIEKERRLNDKEYHRQKRSEESGIEKERRITQDKEYHRQKHGQPSKDWKQELIDKALLTHICTSECRYRPKASMVVVRDKMFTSEQMRLLTINNETLSIDGKHYVCKYCKKIIKKNKIPPCNEKIKKFIIDKLPEEFLTEKMSLSKLESHLLKLIIPFIRIAYIPGYGQYKVKGPMITVEADVTNTLNEKILPRQQELIPVALKRKLSYKGTVMEEMVSKNKVQAYFDYFKQYNPLFVDESLDMQRIDNWIEELKSTQEHENDDNNMDDMPTIDVNSVICNDEEDMPITISHAVPKEKNCQEKIYEGRTNDDNIGTYNNVRNIPMATAYNMSDVEKFVRFDNSSGQNNCWINCVLRALSVMVEWIPNYSYQSEVPMIKALMNYVKDMTYINNGRTLDVNSRGIYLEQNSQPLSVKQLFSTMIQNDEFNSNRQQDAGEGLILILQFIQELGLTEMNFIDPFRFCYFSWRPTKTCLKCHQVEELSSHEGNIVPVYAPRTGFFDMKQAVTSKLEDVTEQNIECENCANVGVTYRTQYITTQKVMIIQLNFVDNFGIKLKSKCIPLPNFNININGQTKKYELHYIIEHIGSNYNSGHYMSYFKKNNTWYCANDTSITRIETQKLPTQPYINIYKEVDSVSLSTVEPVNVEDIELQENINKEQNKIFNRNVISRCVDCEKEVSHMCKMMQKMLPQLE